MQREDSIHYRVRCKKSEASTEGMAVAGRRKSYCCGEDDTQPRRSITNLPFNAPDYQDRRVSPNPCSVYHTPWWSLSEASEDAMHISWVKPTAIYSSCQVCGRRTAVVSVQLTTKYGIYSAKKVPGKNAGSEWFERQRLIDVWAGVEQSVIDNVIIDHWRKPLYARIRVSVSVWHFEFWLWHRLVKKLLAVIN